MGASSFGALFENEARKANPVTTALNTMNENTGSESFTISRCASKTHAHTRVPHQPHTCLPTRDVGGGGEWRTRMRKLSPIDGMTVTISIQRTQYSSKPKIWKSTWNHCSFANHCSSSLSLPCFLAASTKLKSSVAFAASMIRRVSATLLQERIKKSICTISRSAEQEIC